MTKSMPRRVCRRQPTRRRSRSRPSPRLVPDDRPPRGAISMNLLITGGAGFIGSHLADRRLARGDRVVVLDDFNDFYDPAVKRAHVAPHRSNPGYRLVE